MKKKVSVALCQFSMNKDLQLNLKKTLDYLEQAASRNVDLVIFPECQFSQYFPQFPGQDASQYLVKIDDPLIKEIQSLCKKLHLFTAVNIYLAQNGKQYSATPT